jgi:hypothetical protein
MQLLNAIENDSINDFEQINNFLKNLPSKLKNETS